MTSEKLYKCYCCGIEIFECVIQGAVSNYTLISPRKSHFVGHGWVLGTQSVHPKVAQAILVSVAQDIVREEYPDAVCEHDLPELMNIEDHGQLHWSVWSATEYGQAALPISLSGYNTKQCYAGAWYAAAQYVTSQNMNTKGNETAPIDVLGRCKHLNPEDGISASCRICKRVKGLV